MSAPTGRPPTEERLDSWKEIAAYFGREVRTVQGWEKTEGLPVHRHQHSRQGSVYAFKAELDAWREARKAAPEAPKPAAVEPPAMREMPPSAPEARSHKNVLWAAAGIAAALVLAFVLAAKHHGAASNDTISSVVVLPFIDLSPQKDQEYFSDGLTEEIIDGLSRVPRLRVVARTSAFSFKGKGTDIREIGRQLNVDAVLEGSVRKSGDELRITAQLNRATDGTHLWSRTYDRHLRDVFTVQREMSQTIAAQLQAGEIQYRDRTGDAEAYRLYEEGRYFFNQFQEPDSNYKAIDRYRKAIQRDPKFAAAYAGIADAYAYLAEVFVSAPREVMPKALEAAAKAVALDDDSAEGHTSLGIVKLDYERDSDGAQREFQRAMQLNPGSGYAHHWYAHSLEAQGRLEDAMREMRVSLNLDPLSIPINWDIGSELLCAGRYDEALEHLLKANELFPNVPIIQYLTALAYYRKGDVRTAHTLVEKMKRWQPGLDQYPAFLSLYGIEAAHDGRPAEARQALEKLERMHQSQYVEPFLVLELCMALNDPAQVRLWLRRADEERSTLFVYLPIFRRFFPSDPLEKGGSRSGKHIAPEIWERH